MGFYSNVDVALMQPITVGASDWQHSSEVHIRVLYRPSTLLACCQTPNPIILVVGPNDFFDDVKWTTIIP